MSDFTSLIAITGGIGAGKSVVSEILRCMGYPVYDCDSRARIIMDSDPLIHRRLVLEIHPRAVVDGVIDRPLIADTVFNSADKLACLNDIVHGAVVEDVTRWRRALDAPLAFVETAILYQCNLWRLVEGVWEVDAPLELRISRVMSRNNLSRDQVLARVDSQTGCALPQDHPGHTVIYNDNLQPLLPAIHSALSLF